MLNLRTERALCLLVLLSAPLPAARAQTQPASSVIQDAQQSAWKLAQTDPSVLLRRVLQNEVTNSRSHRPPLRYQLRKRTTNSDTTKEIVETADGGVARLIAIRDRPLTPSQEQAEVARLDALNTNAAIQEHRRRKEMHDAAQIGEIMHLLPEAFLYQLASPVNAQPDKDIIFAFTPNPKFSPPSLQARVLTGIRGKMWINPTDLRIVRIEGHLFRSVDYGWGILGVLDPGGSISIEQKQFPSAGWQMSHLKLDLQGKALLVKSLHVVTDETAIDYQLVPKNWTYKDAVQWLLQMPMKPSSPAR